ncbi:uncharacterized protein LOC116032777 [Ipomoea triloba]|uniref:uncharacterized protein LOC116032777 n=1 Tax=Ipomoea triloba TaxID=35885 RepID=UPI00125DDD79|nr:uncharacterized protein LOC116032777 [Ipomoea triloba]
MNSPIAGPGTDREDELADAAKEARNLSEWFSKRGTLQAETVSACLSALSSPLLSRRRLFGSEPDRTAANDTSEISGGGNGSLARKIGVGILAAAYVGMILTILLVVAAVLGVAVVRVWVEEPVLLKERLNFDYTDAQPKAVFSFVHRGGGEYNRELGIFQVYSNPNSQFIKSIIFFLLPLSWRLGVPTAATKAVSEAAATNRRGPSSIDQRGRSGGVDRYALLLLGRGVTFGILTCSKVDDGDHIDRLISCLYMAIPFFERGASNSKFLNYLNKHNFPVFDKKAKDGGLDVIQTYVFWNGHEPSPGKYNFEGRYDLVRFIKLVHQARLYVHLRIGPYIFGEWNFGGFPVWPKYVPGMEFRTGNQPFKVVYLIAYVRVCPYFIV